jgi:hypothetical protein
VWPDMNLALLLPLEHCPHSPLQISIAPHEDTPLLRRYIVFHLEQSWSLFMQSVRYLTLLREAQAVWTFTAQQTALLSSFGVDPQKIWCLPVYTDRRYLLATYQTFNTQETDPSQDKEGDDAGESGGHQYDILIFGSSSARRLRFVEEFSRNASLFSLPISFFRLISGPQYSLMGKRRDGYVRSSKVWTSPSTHPLLTCLSLCLPLSLCLCLCLSLCLSLSLLLDLSLSLSLSLSLWLCFHRSRLFSIFTPRSPPHWKFID